MPDAEHGVAVYRWNWSSHGRDFNDEFVHADDLDTTEPLIKYEPGRWYSEEEAAALEAVIAAAREWRTGLLAKPLEAALEHLATTRGDS